MNNTTNTQSAQPAAHTPGPWILQIDENDIFVEAATARSKISRTPETKATTETGQQLSTLR